MDKETPLDSSSTSVDKAKADTYHIENKQTITDAARAGNEDEVNMGLLKALKMYPKAVMWSVIMSTALVMEGYDLVLIGSFYAQPQFAEKYGAKQANGEYELTAAWQSGLSNGSNVGEIIGLLCIGYVSEKLGHRKTMLACLFIMTCFIFIVFFAKNIVTLLVGEILLGIPWGAFQTMTTAYASEVTPVALRPYLTTYVNICWVIGQLIGSGVLRGVLSRDDQWAYRIPFAIQWVWPIPLFIGCYLAPDSPWWLVRRGDYDGARNSLRRLYRKSMGSAEYIENQLAMIVHTNEIEKRQDKGTSYLECFKGVNLRRTEIALCVWVIQSFTGSSLINYSTYFFVQAGLSKDFSFDMSIITYVIGLLGTILSWFVMGYLGRRTLYIVGLMLQCAILLIAGFLGIPKETSATSWATGAMLLAFTLVYDSAVGPVCYSLVAEIPTTRLKSKTLALARMAYLIANIVTAIITPRMLNPTAWNWKGKSGFFFAGTSFVSLVYCFFRLPEPKGRTYAELDILFEKNVPAIRFKKTEVDPYDSHHVVDEMLEVEQETPIGFNSMNAIKEV